MLRPLLHLLLPAACAFVPALAGALAWETRDITAEVDRAIPAFEEELVARHGLASVSARRIADAVAVELPPGHVSVAVRPASGGNWRDRVTPWFEVRVDGALRKTLMVPLTVSGERTVLRTVRALDSGTGVEAGDVEPVRVPMVAGAPSPGRVLTLAELEPQRFIATEPIAAGAILDHAPLRDTRAMRRGDTVSVLMASGGVEVELPGTLLEDAQPGQVVRVSTARSRTPLRAAFTDGRFVVMDEQGVRK